MTIIRTVEELKAIYDGTSEASIAKVTATLTAEYRLMIETSPFLALATVGPEGMDCSPRGDKGGVVRVADDRTVLLPDWRGNNRVDSLLNIVRDPRVALMFLIPGSNTTMRINGRAVVSVAPDLLESFEMDGKHPRTVIVVTIDEVYFQCARALMRSVRGTPIISSIRRRSRHPVFCSRRRRRSSIRKPMTANGRRGRRRPCGEAQ